MKLTASVSFALATVFFVGACGGEGEDDGPRKRKRKKGDDSEVLGGAPGVTLREIAIYQGLKRSLEIDGVPQQPSIPLVAGRDAVVRIFYSTDANYDGGEVLGSLAIDGSLPLQVRAPLRTTPSVEEDMGSTLNIAVPGNLIGETFTYSAGLLREGVSDNPAARYPTQGFESVAVEGKNNKLRVVLVPFRYDADGSGRLPDTSPESVEALRTRFKQLYPVSDVEVTVREPLPWKQTISPNGEGWQEANIRLVSLRNKDNAPDDVYYYGTFNPRPTAYQFCGGGCLLGLTFLNNDPADVGEVQLRLGVGVGYPEYFNDTAVHEIGHAHGREHAPCGPGLEPNSVDQDYPYAKGQIGVWGMDVATQTLVPPTTTDLMGYCENIWISDYNYRALLQRGQAVNMPKWHAPPARRRMELVTVDGAGVARWRGTETFSENLRGRALRAAFIDDTGARSAVEAKFLQYDHLPGGWLLLPEAPERARRVEVELDAKRVIAER